MSFRNSQGGMEFTGGFEERTTGLAGSSSVGSNFQYTEAMADSGTWKRFGFSESQQILNDVAYWTSPAPKPTAGVGLFGGSHLPGKVSKLFDFGFNDSQYSDEKLVGDILYTQADGSYDFSQCRVGDLVLVRFDFNVLTQIANTSIECALIWQTRDANDNATFTFPLSTSPLTFGREVGETKLVRPFMSAYIASDEDLNAKALPAIRSNNEVQIQPLTTLCVVVR